MRTHRTILGGIFNFTLISAFLVGCGGGGGSSTPTTPTSTQPPTTTNTPPTFSSSASVSIDENALGEVYTLVATDSDGSISRLELQATPDANFFVFDATTGILSIPTRLNFSTPSDDDINNTYELTFEAEDNDNAITTFQVTVTITEASLKARLPPSGNFELIDWKLDLPISDTGELSGLSGKVDEVDLANGYESEWFFTGPDGGMVLRAPAIGASTSGSSFSRTELREMLRRGNTSISTRGAGDQPNGNNWALSSAPQSAQDTAGGVDGTLQVTMAVNEVTTTGDSHQIGRLVIGQIHAKDDEPIRLYYRKLPDNENGSIYAEHELVSGGSDIRFEIVGDSASDASNPSDGIALDEKFTYEIVAVGNLLNVTISQDGTTIGSTQIDMTLSGYDVADDFMYFKAGTYHVNNTADASEAAQVTIYELTNTHIGYPF